MVIPGQGAHYYTSDRLGSVLALSDGSGAVEATYDYSAFGETTRTDLAPTAPANPFAFTGEYFTEPLRGGPALPGLYNLRARQYDPSTGRFLSRDPLALGAGTCNSAALTGSSYAYVRNRPTVGTDPSGMWFGGDVLWEMTHNPVASWQSGAQGFCSNAGVQGLRQISFIPSPSWFSAMSNTYGYSDWIVRLLALQAATNAGAAGLPEWLVADYMSVFRQRPWGATGLLGKAAWVLGPASAFATGVDIVCRLAPEK